MPVALTAVGLKRTAPDPPIPQRPDTGMDARDLGRVNDLGHRHIDRTH
jgi:hypothetical protein